MDHKGILTELVVTYLRNNKWSYTQNENKFSVNLNIDSKLSSCKLSILVFSSGIAAFAICPIKASKDVYGEVVEYITRVNFFRTIDTFEFDYSDGEIRCRTFLSSMECAPDMEDIERIIELPVLSMEKYGNGLLKCLFGFGTAEKNAEEAEQQ